MTLLHLRRWLSEKGAVWFFGLVLLFCAAFAHAQGLRWDLGAPGSAGVVTVGAQGGLPALLAQPGAGLNWCNYPANAVPCTNFATTYTSLTLSTSCPTNTPVVLQGSSTCQATGDNFGNMGVYAATNTSCGGFTCFAYTLTVNGVSSGPYLWMAAPTGLPDPGANGILYRSAPNTVRIAVVGDVTTLFGTCTALDYLRGDGTCPAFAFPALQGGTNNTGAFVLGNGASLSFASGAFLDILSGADLNLSAGGVMNLQSGTPTTALILPSGAGAAPVNPGVFAYDTTAEQPVFGNSSATQKLIPLSGSTPTTTNCASFLVTGTNVALTDAGTGPCLTTSNVKAVQASSITLLGSIVGVTGTTSVLSKAVTMPSSGCPCRAFVSYGAYWDASNAGQFTNAISDGTNVFATAETNTTGSATDFGISSSSFSTGTYANNATITFVLQAKTTAAGSTNVHINNAPALGQATWMNVVIFNSN